MSEKIEGQGEVCDGCKTLVCYISTGISWCDNPKASHYGHVIDTSCHPACDLKHGTKQPLSTEPDLKQQLQQAQASEKQAWERKEGFERTELIAAQAGFEKANTEVLRLEAERDELKRQVEQAGIKACTTCAYASESVIDGEHCRPCRDQAGHMTGIYPGWKHPAEVERDAARAQVLNLEQELARLRGQ